MLAQLAEIENQLPELLSNRSKWQSLKIDKYPPVIHRLYLPLENGNTILLHRLFNCNGQHAYLHSHSWPFAIKVLEGGYEMGIGFSKDRDIPPDTAATVFIKAGDTYQITSPDVWHYTKPLTNEESWSIMLIGPRWRHRKAQNNEPLSAAEIDSMFEYYNKIRN